MVDRACFSTSRPAPWIVASAVTLVSIVTGSVSSAPITADRIVHADREPQNWLAHGRTYDEQRYSPLRQIDASNVGRLGLAWSYATHTTRGLQATPLVVDGRLYATGVWSVVYALDAKTGKELWTYDPQVPREWGRYACCDAVNRGVALWGDSLFVGTLDGRLVSLDAKTGRKRWEVDTIDRTRPYTITGAPRVVKGKVLIGNGGAEYGVRGYFTAYDANTGRRIWRFYTVPGDPRKRFEQPELEIAAKTWTGEWWRGGGGGTVWDSMAYDSELDTLYVGTGNGSPWSRRQRSEGKGDNLFLSTVLALNPDTGAYIWHYQESPGESWDYTSVQPMMLVDLTIAGTARKALLHAPKNGFFYVLDRRTGKVISANNFVPVNWATSVDVATGRPAITANAFYDDGPFFATPTGSGAHNWSPWSFSPRTGLV